MVCKGEVESNGDVSRVNESVLVKSQYAVLRYFECWEVIPRPSSFQKVAWSIS